MSWMKYRAVPGSASSGRLPLPPTSATPPTPPVQMYNPNQHSSPQLNSQQWQQVDLSAPSTNTWYDNQQPVQQQNNWYPPQTQQPYQPPPTQQHQQLYSNQQQSTSYYQQQPNQQVHYQPQQQTLYQPTLPQQQQQPMQSYINSSTNVIDNKSEVWNDWNTWDDEDNSNNTQNMLEESLNANVKQEVVEESFATNQSWNLAADEQKETATLADNNQHANDLFHRVNLKTESVDTLKQEQSMKTIKSETLTPQWSIESQPSQDSSTDDVALLQSDTEQKHIANTTTTTTSNSNPVSSSDLISNSLTSTTTSNTNSIENKEVVGGLEQTQSHVPQTSGLGLVGATNILSGNMRDLHSGQNRLANVVGNGKSLSGQHAGVGYQQSGLNQQSVRTASNNYRINNTAATMNQSAPDNIEVTSSTLLQSERNQYLETGQLLGDNGDNADSSLAPPPAFSRVVVGQRESNDDVRFGAERTLPAGSAVARTSTYRPRGDTSDDDEDSAFDDNEPLAPSFQPILPRSATIGAETLTPSPFLPPSQPTIVLPPNQTSDTSNNFNQQQEQRDTHLDGANTLDDFNQSTVQQDLNQAQPGGGEAIGGGSSIGEGGSGPEGHEEDLLGAVVGGMRQLVVSGGESDGQRASDIKRSNKHTNDSSEDIPQPLSDGHLPPPNAATTSNQKRPSHQQRQSSSNNKARVPYTDDYAPQQERGDNTSSRRPPTETNRRTATTGGRGDYGDSRRGDPGRRYNRRRDRSEDSIDYDREAGGLLSGEEDRDRRQGEGHRRGRRKDVGDDDGYGRDGRRLKADERDRYRPRDDPRSSYYRPSTKRCDEYDDFDDDLGGGASRASSRSESLQEVYRGDRNRDRNRDRDGDRRHRADRDDRDRREKQSGSRGYGGRRGDPYGGAAYMQGYYDPYGHNSAQAHPYYYQHYQYYENLRVTNPQAYAEWYRKFYQGQQGTMQQQQQSPHQRGMIGSINTGAGSAITEDRASLHSGRSSTNDDLAKERYLRQCYYGGHNAAAILQHQHNASVGYYHSLNRDSASISSHYGLDDSRQDYTDSNTLNTSFQPIDTSSTSLSHYGLSTTQQQARLTPAKFSTSHAIASLTSSVTGQLVNVPVQYPQDGEGAVVQLVALGDILGDEGEYGEMVRFPGPLVRGVTHKKTVIEYCEEKIRTAREDIVVDCDSYILLWELLILLLSHNGVVVGADISDLLMRNNRSQLDQNIRPSSVNSNTSSNACIDQNSNSETNTVNLTNENKFGNTVSLKEDAITNKFRQYLIYGSVKEALEWAMKNGLWGHALFLASKLDKRTYANVMKRFANGLPINDPLQTLYQLLSGSIPAAVTCVAEERWGDWRPHLAMILANSTSNPDLECRSILHLGDTLDTRGSIYAAQFCYLMAQVEFGGGKLSGLVGNGENDGNNRLVLLGGDRRALEGNVGRYARTEAIHMTEVYEYACGLNGDGFCIPAFQSYKYILATRLCDHGLAERSLAYLERIATIILASHQSSPPTTDNSQNTSTLTGTSGAGNSTIFHPVLVNKVCQLADRLRYCDPSDELQQEGEDGEESNGWLERLMKLDTDYSMGLISHSTTQNQETDNNQQYAANPEELTYDQKIWQQPQQHAEQEAGATPQQQWQHDQNQQQHVDTSFQQQQPFSLDQTLTEGQSDYNQPQAFWPNESQQLSSYNSPVSSDLQDHLRSPDSRQWNHTQTEPTTPVAKSKGVDSHPPSPKRPSDDVPHQRQQISMPNQSSRKAYDDDETSGPVSLQASSTKTKPQHTAKLNPKNDNKGWLGGIFGRFSMRPKNQMKLPDDKNPTIVWDPVKKRWINTEEDGGDTASELRPPPKMADLMPPQKMQPNSLPSMSFSTVPTPTMVTSQQNGGSNMAAMPGQAGAQPPMVDAVNAVMGKPPIQGGNMFKMQRGRNLKKSYVDVFNPAGISSSGGGSAPALMADNSSTVPSAASGIPNFFIPPPVADPNAPTDFLTPTTGLPSIVDHQQQPRSRSRCSSPTSSLSHEVMHYMATATPAYRRLTPTLRSLGSYDVRR